jgi:putative peptide zinc metalloprotease protein
VTELLYRIAEQANGERTLDQIAAGVGESTEWSVSRDHVRHFLQTTLIPRGLVTPVSGSVAPARSDPVRSPLLVNMRLRMLSTRIIDPIANVLQVLYAPPVLIPVLVAIALAHRWLYFDHGLAGSLEAALYTPGGLFQLLGVLLCAGVFHELGHAAALRYGGGRSRGMGAGLYVIYPVLYTDVTDGYRLGRWARVRTDLGGFYFHLIFALGIVALSFISGQELLMFAVVVIDLAIIQECLPFVRWDGYWAFADLTGIPDFFALMGPFVRSILPLPTRTASKLPPLKPWVKAVFTLYIFATVPVLGVLLVFMVSLLPSLLAMTWAALRFHTELWSSAWSTADAWLLLGTLTQMVFLALPTLGLAYMLYATGRKLMRGIWLWSKPTPTRRAIGGLATLGLLGGLGYLWVPQLPLHELPFLRPSAPDGVQSFEVLERNHVAYAVDYPQTPPVGGNHAPIWQNCGFYAEPVADETAVHSMEHGAVWITYQPDLPQSQLESLQQLARGQSDVLVSPSSDLPTSVVASAWGRQLQLESVDDARLKQFVLASRNGDQAPERGGPCSGGRGSPA